MEKLYKLTLYLLMFILTTGCSTNDNRKQLAVIENMLGQQKNEEANKLLNDIHPEALEDDSECKALYWLFKMQSDVRLGNPIPSVDPLRFSVDYFKKRNDLDRLVWVYYYMGFVLDDLGRKSEAVIFLKKGENIALKDKKHHKNILHHIYQCLTFMNMNAKEYELAKRYGYLALKYGHYMKDVCNEATDLSNMSSIYSDIGNKDSAYYYINRIIPLLDSVPSSKYALYCGNIGIEAMGRDDEKAKYYLLKSIEKENDPYFCKALAQIYTKEGNKEKANEMWHKALQTTNLSLKANVVKGMAKAKTEEGDYKAAHELDLWAAALKDSLHRQQKEENLKGQQELFDKEIANEHLREKHNRAAWAVAALLLTVAFLAVWTVQKKRKNRQLVEALDEELTEREKAMKLQAAKIEQLQQDNEKKIQQLNRLSHDMKDFEQKHEKQLAEGQQLYESITVNRGNTLKWGKKDFANFVLYYKLKHPEFVNHLENERSELTPRQKTFFILYDMGMTDEDVMRTLVLTGSSVRSNKSRLKFDEMMGVEKEEAPGQQEE